jgi:type IV secretory pathway TraG/TraD family ATPase VirD4
VAQIDDSFRGRFNPLDALDPQSEEAIDQAGRLADAIVIVREDSKEPFWDESARSLVRGLLLHVLSAPQYEGRRNLLTLRKLIQRGDWESWGLLREAGEENVPPAQGLLWTAVANNPAFGGLVAGIGDSFVNMVANSGKQYEDVRQIADRNTEFIDSPPMQRCLESSDFALGDLKTRSEGLSLYLCLPQSNMNTHYRWLRMMIALTVTEMEKVRGRPATGFPVLMMLDEFAGLKRMEIIESAVAQIAGFGVKMFFVLQSLEQLKAVYKDNWETFLANSGLKIFFNIEDHFSRDYIAKLIGETEVVRQVRSASDSVSQSESVSRSTSQSRSQTAGRSSSTGTSETEGTNSSTSTGRSWGVSKSKGHSWNWSEGRNWTPGLLWRNYEDKQSEGYSHTLSTNKSKSEGWNEGESHGTSQSTSRSRTDGTSESWTTGTSETEGTTSGTSQSRSSGMSETIQKRALVTPDEIGQLFARVNDRQHPAYPGLALVLVSGARPVAVRRVNYFEDLQFIKLFDPHPDFPYNAPKELTVEANTITTVFQEHHLHISKWMIAPKQIVAAEEEAALVAVKESPIAPIRVPRAGLVTSIEATLVDGVPSGPMFSLMYYENGQAAADPFGELRAAIAKMLVGRADRERETNARVLADADKARNKKRNLIIAAVCCGALALMWIIGTVSSHVRDEARRDAARGQAAEEARQREIARQNEAASKLDGRLSKDRPKSDAARQDSSPPQPTSPVAATAPDNSGIAANGQMDRSNEGTLSASGNTHAESAAPAAPVKRTIDFCLPRDVVERLSWNDPGPPESEMATFRHTIVYYIRGHGMEGITYRVRPDAFARFDQGWRSSRATPPESLVDTLPIGERCSEDNYTYQVNFAR